MKATSRVSLVLILVGLMVVLSFPGLTGAGGGGANVVRGEDCTISLAEVGGGDVAGDLPAIHQLPLNPEPPDFEPVSEP